MRPEERQREWDELAAVDPLWAVLSNADKRGGKWNVEEFFRLGESDIDRLVQRLGECGFGAPHGRALDFGCGVGRLVQALARHYERVDGVDISGRMVEHGQRYNRRGGAARYHVNTAFDLRLFAAETFDLVHTIMVLQHMESDVACGYLREFVRVARPGGAIAFQAPAGYASTLKGRALAIVPDAIRPRLHRLIKGDPIEMHTTRREVVERVLSDAGADLVRDYPDVSSGPHYVSWFYIARKRP